jgi:hypothetical protein
MSNEKLFEQILDEFNFPNADRNEEQFEMVEVIEKPCLQQEINVAIQCPRRG